MTKKGDENSFKSKYDFETEERVAKNSAPFYKYKNYQPSAPKKISV